MPSHSKLTFLYGIYYAQTEVTLFLHYFLKVYKSVWSHMSWFDMEALHTQSSS